MDLKMPVLNGIEATRRIKDKMPETAILVLTTYDDDEWLFDAVRAGASGCLLKDTKREEIFEAIKQTVKGKSFVDPKVAGKLLDVLRLLARGLSNHKIADELHVSEGTVRNHVSSIFSKLEVSDRTQAAVLAIKHGLDRSSPESFVKRV